VVHVDTWRAAYRGIVPESHLDGLSYYESERLWQDVIAASDGCVFVAEDGGGILRSTRASSRRSTSYRPARAAGREDDSCRRS
jgi:hypothetical protein